MEEIVSYEDKLRQAKFRLRKGWMDDRGENHSVLLVSDKKLPKKLSKSILCNECPFCEYEEKCYQKSMYNPERRLCLNRSTETLRVWLWYNNIRPKVEIGNTYGILMVIGFSHRDKHNNSYFKCKCQCGQSKVVRSDNLLGGKTTSCGCLSGKSNKLQTFSGNRVLLCEENKELFEMYSAYCKAGAMTNPDHSRHVCATEHQGRIGKKLDTLVEVKYPDHPEDNYKYYVDKTCDECGGILRTNSRAEQECERCNLV